MRSLDFDDSKQNQQSLGGTGTLYGLQSILCSTPAALPCPAHHVLMRYGPGVTMHFSRPNICKQQTDGQPSAIANAMGFIHDMPLVGTLRKVLGYIWYGWMGVKEKES